MVFIAQVGLQHLEVVWGQVIKVGTDQPGGELLLFLGLGGKQVFAKPFECQIFVAEPLFRYQTPIGFERPANGGGLFLVQGGVHQPGGFAPRQREAGGAAARLRETNARGFGRDRDAIFGERFGKFHWSGFRPGHQLEDQDVALRDKLIRFDKAKAVVPKLIDDEVPGNVRAVVRQLRIIYQPVVNDHQRAVGLEVVLEDPDEFVTVLVRVQRVDVVVKRTEEGQIRFPRQPQVLVFLGHDRLDVLHAHLLGEFADVINVLPVDVLGIHIAGGANQLGELEAVIARSAADVVHHVALLQTQNFQDFAGLFPPLPTRVIE